MPSETVEQFLHHNHPVLGVEYCTGYVDDNGQWQKGFYCPKKAEGIITTLDRSKDIFCCGTQTSKHCCERKEGFSTSATSGFYVSFSTLVLVTTVTFVLAVLLTALAFICCRKYWKDRNRDVVSLHETHFYRMACSSSNVPLVPPPFGQSSLPSFQSNAGHTLGVTPPMTSPVDGSLLPYATLRRSAAQGLSISVIGSVPEYPPPPYQSHPSLDSESTTTTSANTSASGHSVSFARNNNNHNGHHHHLHLPHHHALDSSKTSEVQNPMDIETLDEGYRAIGIAYCTGYADKKGKWQDGFYCATVSPDKNAFCCGHQSHKYCCNENPYNKEASPPSNFMSVGNLMAVAMVTFAATTMLTYASIVLYRKYYRKDGQANCPNNNPRTVRVSCSTSISGLASYNGQMSSDANNGPTCDQAASNLTTMANVQTAEPRVQNTRYVQLPSSSAMLATGSNQARIRTVQARVSFMDSLVEPYPPSYAMVAVKRNDDTLMSNQSVQVLARPTRGHRICSRTSSPSCRSVKNVQNQIFPSCIQLVPLNNTLSP